MNIDSYSVYNIKINKTDKEMKKVELLFDLIKNHKKTVIEKYSHFTSFYFNGMTSAKLQINIDRNEKIECMFIRFEQSTTWTLKFTNEVVSTLIDSYIDLYK